MPGKRDTQTITPEDVGAFAPGAPGPFDANFTPPGQQEVLEDSWTEDFTDVSGFDNVPAGIHPAILKGLRRGESKGGKPQYEWDFLVTGGDASEQKIKFWTSLSPAARWKIAETLEALGQPARGKVVTINRQELLNKPCLLEVIMDDYDGTVRSKIQRVLPPDQTAITEAELRSETPNV